MIVRSKRRDTYTKIDNEIFKNVNDLVAVGLLAYLLSLPDDWTVYKTTIYPKFKQGRGAVDRAFKILKELGYLVGKRKKDSKGLIDGFEWIVYETPFDRGFIHTTEIGLMESSIPPKSIDSISIPMEIHRMENGVLLTTNNKPTTNLQTTQKEEQRISPEKKEIFNIWIEYRREIKKPIKIAKSLKMVIDRFEKEPLEKVVEVVNLSIENGWQGLFWEKSNFKKSNNGQSIIKAAESRSWNASEGV